VNGSDPTGQNYWWQKCQAPHGWGWANPFETIGWGYCGANGGLGIDEPPPAKGRIKTANIAFDQSIFAALGLPTDQVISQMPAWGDEWVDGQCGTAECGGQTGSNDACGISCQWVFGPVIQLETNWQEHYGLANTTADNALYVAAVLIMAHDVDNGNVWKALDLNSGIGISPGGEPYLTSTTVCPPSSGSEYGPVETSGDASLDWVQQQIAAGPYSSGFDQGSRLLQAIFAFDPQDISDALSGDVVSSAIVPLFKDAAKAYTGI
jgi:hypothetical protein